MWLRQTFNESGLVTASLDHKRWRCERGEKLSKLLGQKVSSFFRADTPYAEYFFSDTPESVHAGAYHLEDNC